MWPRSIERGIEADRPDRRHAREASMWPRSIERGILRSRPPAPRVACASMWPRSIERGIPAAPGAPPAPPAGFNVAALDRARNQHDDRDDDASVSRFNVAALDRARNRPMRLSPSQHRPRFNVAALDRARNQRWKAQMMPALLASMWPRSIERGIHGQHTEGADESKLQCGRARSSAESQVDDVWDKAQGQASMWPRSIERGI